MNKKSSKKIQSAFILGSTSTVAAAICIELAKNHNCKRFHLVSRNPDKNQELIKIIKKTKLNNFYIKNKSDFRDYIFKDISSSDDVLDIGKSMRDKFEKINSKLDLLA